MFTYKNKIYLTKIEQILKQIFRYENGSLSNSGWHSGRPAKLNREIMTISVQFVGSGSRKRLWRSNFKKLYGHAKGTLLQLRLERNIKANNIFQCYISNKMLKKGNMGLLLYEMGDSATLNTGKSEVLSASTTSLHWQSFLCLSDYKQFGE